MHASSGARIALAKASLGKMRLADTNDRRTTLPARGPCLGPSVGSRPRSECLAIRSPGTLLLPLPAIGYPQSAFRVSSPLPSQGSASLLSLVLLPKPSRRGSRCVVNCSLAGEMSGDVAKSLGSLGPGLYPLHRCKTIHLVRHGQGYHNVEGEINREAYMSYEFFDASLTPKGWKQVAALRKHLKATGVYGSVQLVVVSPLTRTMQTATGAFGGEDVSGALAEDLLMVDSVGKAQHEAISSEGAPPFIAVEWCREQMGMHPCDKRQSITTYKTLFPAIDFSNVEDDEDKLWQAAHRESEEATYARAKKLVQWLLARPEKEIAVVSHSSFLFHLLAIFGADCSSAVQDELHALFANCEMRTVLLADRRAIEPWRGATVNFVGGTIGDGDGAPTF